MKKLAKQGFDHKPESSDWKLKGKYKGNKNYAQYQQHKRSLDSNAEIDTDALMEEFLKKGGTITSCPKKVA